MKEYRIVSIERIVVTDFDWKSLTKEELQHIFSGVNFNLAPMWHQLVSLAFASERSRTAFFHDVGTGKTLTSLYTAKLWNCKKILVVAPLSAFGAWKRDIKNYTDFSYVILSGSGRERKSKLKNEKNIYIISYEGLKTIFCKLYKNKGWQIIPNSFTYDFDCIVLDEVHKCKNYASLQSRICLELSKRCGHLIGLTGTPIDQSYLELFNIFRVIDLGKSLGTNFFNYRYRFFDRHNKGRWVDWIIKPNCEEKILNLISDITLRFDREECFELPEIQEIVKYVYPTEQFTSFEKAIIHDESLKVSGKVISASENISVKAHRLKQIPNGFIYYKEDGQRVVLRLKKNPKVEAFLDLLEDSNSKVILFYQLIEERNILEGALRKEGIQFVSLFGGQEHDEREDKIASFTLNKDVKVLLAQTTIASEGFDGSIANVAAFFSPLSSPKLRKQCIGRIHRKGQVKKCLVVDFVMEHSMDERVIQNRSERFDLVKETLAYIRDFHRNLDSGEI